MHFRDFFELNQQKRIGRFVQIAIKKVRSVDRTYKIISKEAKEAHRAS